jgi:predicted Na+-dependent transporter
MHFEKLVAPTMLVALTLSAGLQVDRENLIAILKNIGLLGRALLANFIIVPILGVLLAKAFVLPKFVATGFLLMAIAPGVPFVLSNVRKKGGSLGFAIELAVFLPLLSILTVPVTAQLVLPAGAAAQLPLGHFIITLVLFQLIPLLLGIAIANRIPRIAPPLARLSHIVFLVTVVLLLVMLAPRLVKDVTLVYGSHGMLAMLCLVILSMGTGWVLGGPRRQDRRILGIGTALRNIGLAAVVATSSSFRGTPLIASTVLTYLLIQFVVTALFSVYFTRTAARARA